MKSAAQSLTVSPPFATREAVKAESQPEADLIQRIGPSDSKDSGFRVPLNRRFKSS